MNELIIKRIDNFITKQKVCWHCKRPVGITVGKAGLCKKCIKLAAEQRRVEKAAYHPLHGIKFKTQETADKELSNIGAKHTKTIPRETTKTRVYSHPKLGTFTTVESGKKTTILHYPTGKKIY